MPVTTIISLHSPKGLLGALEYVQSTTTPSHREYSIETQDWPNFTTDFVADVCDRVRRLNDESGRSHQTRRLAEWVIVRMEDGAWLSATERARIHAQIRIALAFRGQAPGAWHVNELSGASDLNLIVPCAETGPLPIRRRSFDRSLWTRVRSAADAVVCILNQERRANALPPLREGSAIRATRQNQQSVETIIAHVAVSALARKVPVTAANLPLLLSDRRALDVDWSIHDEYVERRLNKRRLRLQIDELLLRARAEVQRQLAENNKLSPGAPQPRAHSANAVPSSTPTFPKNSHPGDY